jgi:NitT/TauT family transport system permease protein
MSASTEPAAPPNAMDQPEPRKAATSDRLRLWWRRAETFVYPVLAIVGLLVLWQVLVIVLNIAPYLLPKPTDVIATLIQDLPNLMAQSVVTIEEIVAGFALSVIVGIPLAVGIVTWRGFEKTMYPLLVASQTVPKVAIAPLFLVWFGFGQTPKVLIAFLIAFFPIVIDTAVGLRSVPTEMTDLAHSMGASRLALFWKIRFPYALPNIFGGLKVGITLAVIGAIVGEFVGADSGLGYVLVIANGRLDTSLLFAAILVLVLIGIVTFLIVDIAERMAIPWHVSKRKEAVTFGTA